MNRARSFLFLRMYRLIRFRVHASFLNTFVHVYVRFPSLPLPFLRLSQPFNLPLAPRPFVPLRTIFILLYLNCVYTPRCTYKYIT